MLRCTGDFFYCFLNLKIAMKFFVNLLYQCFHNYVERGYDFSMCRWEEYRLFLNGRLHPLHFYFPKAERLFKEGIKWMSELLIVGDKKNNCPNLNKCIFCCPCFYILWRLKLFSFLQLLFLIFLLKWIKRVK